MQLIMHFSSASSRYASHHQFTGFPSLCASLNARPGFTPVKCKAKLLLYFKFFVCAFSMGNLKIRNWMLNVGKHSVGVIVGNEIRSVLV